MKTFCYVMRDKTGALKRGALQAADRADALQQIKAMGSTPVSVTEGKAAAVRPTWTRAAWPAAACAGLVVALAVWRLADRQPKAEGRRQEAGERPNPSSQTSQPRKTSQTSQPTPPKQKPAVAVSAVPASGAPASRAPALMPPPAANRTTPPVKKPEAEPPAEPQRPAPFKTVTEQVLAIVASMPAGAHIPPLPELTDMDNDFARASTNTLVVFDTDSEELANRLETVAWAKVDLAELVKQGWKPDEVLNELARQHNEKASLRSATALALKKMLDNGELNTPTLTSELQLINHDLAEQGLPEITLEELGVKTP